MTLISMKKNEKKVLMQLSSNFTILYFIVTDVNDIRSESGRERERASLYLRFLFFKTSLIPFFSLFEIKITYIWDQKPPYI